MAQEQVFKSVLTTKDESSGPLEALTKVVKALEEALEPISKLDLGVPAKKAKEEYSGLAGVLQRNVLEPFEHINKSATELHKPLSNLQKVIHEIDEKSHFAGMREGLKGAFEYSSKLVGPLEILAGLGSISGLVEMTRSASEYGNELHESSAKTGVDTTSLAKLHFAAQMTGTSAEALDKALFKLNRTMGDAKTGHNKLAASMFEHLKIDIKSGETTDKIFSQLAEAINKTKDPTERTRIAYEAFGKSADELLPLLSEGQQGIEEFGDAAERHGLVMSQTAINLSHAFDEAEKNLEASGTGLKNAIGSKLSPIMTADMNKLTDFIDKHRDWIADNVAGFVTMLSNVITGPDWDAITKVSIDWPTVEKNIDKLGELVLKIVGVVGEIANLSDPTPNIPSEATPRQNGTPGTSQKPGRPSPSSAPATATETGPAQKSWLDRAAETLAAPTYLLVPGADMSKPLVSPSSAGAGPPPVAKSQITIDFRGLPPGIPAPITRASANTVLSITRQTNTGKAFGGMMPVDAVP